MKLIICRVLAITLVFNWMPAFADSSLNQQLKTQIQTACGQDMNLLCPPAANHHTFKENLKKVIEACDPQLHPTQSACPLSQPCQTVLNQDHAYHFWHHLLEKQCHHRNHPSNAAANQVPSGGQSRPHGKFDPGKSQVAH